MAYLGFESGGTKLVVTLSDDGNNIVASQVIKRHPENHAMDSLKALMQTGMELLQTHHVTNLEAIGFGFGGNVDTHQNRPTLCIHEEGWESLQDRTIIEEAFQAPVFCLNDCDAAALAEGMSTANQDIRHLFYVTLGTGVGGSFLYHREILQTSPSGNTEIGHLIVDESRSIPCPCGQAGCLEAVCSGPGLLRLSKHLYPEHFYVSAESITSGFQHNDAQCIDIMNTYTNYLSKGLSTIITLFHPDRIILGGGLGTFAATVLHDALVDEIRKGCYPSFRKSVSIRPWSVCEGAVSLGAIHYAKRKLKS